MKHKQVPKSIRSEYSSQKCIFPPLGANVPLALYHSLASDSILDLIFYQILPVLNIATAVDFLYLLNVALPSTYLLLK